MMKVVRTDGTSKFKRGDSIGFDRDDAKRADQAARHGMILTELNVRYEDHWGDRYQTKRFVSIPKPDGEHRTMGGVSGNWAITAEGGV